VRVFTIAVQDHPAVAHEDHSVEQPLRLTNQVRREENGARALRVVPKQDVVKQSARRDVQSQVRLVEQGDGSTRREAQDDRDRGELAARELLDRRLRRDAQAVDQLLCDLRAPVRRERRGDPQHVVQAVVVGVPLVVADEADLLQRRGILERRSAEHLDPSTRRTVLAGNDRHNRRFAGAVPSEQPRDRALRYVKAHPVERRYAAVPATERPHLDGVSHCAPPDRSSCRLLTCGFRAVAPRVAEA
jgi:hypothetical protein